MNKMKNYGKILKEMRNIQCEMILMTNLMKLNNY